MSTLAERWVAAVAAAIEMSTPSEIVAAIRSADEPDDGLRAASYEARITTGHRSDSHPERLALEPERVSMIHTWWKRDDTLMVSRQGLAFIDAVSEINAARDAGTAGDWDEAIRDANLMAELHDGHYIATCIDLAHDLAPYHAIIRAVQRLTEIAHRWGCPHVATIQERLNHPDQCLSHARIGVERPVCGRLVVCKTCRDWMAEAGLDVPAIHRDVDVWPTLELLRANEEGRRVDTRRERIAWYASIGVAA